MNLPQVDPWYHEGLQFECTGCGQCCTGAPGYVWLTEEEAIAMTEYLGISIEDFAEQYLKQVDDRLSLRDLLPNYDCVFLKDNKCQVYPVRPKQCRTFPFWAQNLTSPEAWAEASLRCEGIRLGGPLKSLSLIESQLQ